MKEEEKRVELVDKGKKVTRLGRRRGRGKFLVSDQMQTHSDWSDVPLNKMNANFQKKRGRKKP